jgi:hypothetical protein
MGLLDFLFGKPQRYDAQSSLPALAESRLPSVGPNVLNLRVGDVVGYDGVDYVIRNRHVYNSHGFKWYSYHLVDVVSGRKFWLDAEDDDELIVAICEPVQLDLNGRVPSTLHHNREAFYEDEHGFANVLIESEASGPKHSSVEYWDFYNEDDSRFLSVERWGGETEASIGRYIQPFELTLYGSGASHA